MPKKPLLMETTEIVPERTAAEIAACLIQAGATQIATDYDNGKVTGLRWQMRVHGENLMYDMPARVEPVYQILRKRRQGLLSDQEKAKLRARAERVAWRQLLRWVQAQVAMIETGMAQAAEVFFPYTLSIEGKTIYAMFEEQKFKMLAPPRQ